VHIGLGPTRGGSSWRRRSGRPPHPGALMEPAASTPGQRSAEVFEHIGYEVEAPVATITLNRPAQLNAWTAIMGREVREAVRLAPADADVVGHVVTRARRGVCAGADVSALAGHVPDGDAPAALPTEKDGYEF